MRETDPAVANWDIALTTDVLVLGTRTALVVGAIAVGVVSPSLFLDRGPA